jgi:glycosyltransferase involved in cell wall biosynthesis
VLSATPKLLMSDNRRVINLYLSVIICTHNPRPGYLRRVLEALRGQTLPRDQWELLLIDNASDRVLADEWDLSWHLRARHVREDELGLAAARLRGIAEAKAVNLIFVDDDNVLEPNYLEVALRIGREWPQLGVWGGSIVPEFEVEPPAHLQKYLRFLALREVRSARWSNVATCADAEPWGAGMCVRTNVALAYREHYQQAKIQLTDRSGKDLICGGDTEICYVACEIGSGMGLFPELCVTHLIPRERLMDEYLMRLIEGTDTSHHLLSFKWRGVIPRSPFHIIELLRASKNLAMRRAVERRVYLATLRAAFRARSIITAASDHR